MLEQKVVVTNTQNTNEGGSNNNRGNSVVHNPQASRVRRSGSKVGMQ